MADSGLNLQPNPELENRFQFHPANTEQRQRDHNSVRGACLMLSQQLDAILPAGREKALALTNLEQVMFWGNAAIARQPEAGSAQ